MTDLFVLVDLEVTNNLPIAVWTLELGWGYSVEDILIHYRSVLSQSSSVSAFLCSGWSSSSKYHWPLTYDALLP